MQALQDANEKMAKKLEELQKAVAAASDSKPKVKASAKPKLQTKKKPAKATSPEQPDDEPDAAEDGEDEPSQAEQESESESEKELSEAAKKQRLRRVCQRKPSGKLGVPEKVHVMWKEGGSKRDELQELLESAGWDKDRMCCQCLFKPCLQDVFVSKVMRTQTSINRKEGRKKRGWYSAERMKTKLQWSKILGLFFPYIVLE